MLSEGSSTLKHELCGVMFAELARDLPFFHGRDASFVALVGVQLEPFFVLTGEYVCRKGVIGMEMYWLRKGRVSLIDPALVTSEGSMRKAHSSGSLRPPAGPVGALKEDVTMESPAPTSGSFSGRSGSPGSHRGARAGELREVSPGEAFGQEALLFNMRQQWDARALTYCDLLYLR